jgi:hypothetical protein
MIATSKRLILLHPISHTKMAADTDATKPMRCAQIQQLRACRSDVLENRHSVDVGRRRERKRLAPSLGVTTLALRRR